MEIWKEVNGYTNYEVSNTGLVRNKKTLRVLKPWIGGAGYYYVWLGAKYKTSVHRIVALNFLEQPNDKLYIDHIDRNKTNNHINNLRWVNAQENCWNKETKNIHESIKRGVVYYIVNYTISYKTNLKKAFKELQDAENYLEELKIKYPRII